MLMIAAALFFLAGLPRAQEPAFKADISLVEVDAVVIGKGGVVEGLGLSDFAVKDNKKPVSLRYVSQEDTPLDIVPMFETSKLMGRKYDQLTVAAESAMAEFRDRDRIAVMSFSEDIRIELPLTADLKEAKRRIRIGLQNATFGLNPLVLAAADGAERYLAAQPEPLSAPSGSHVYRRRRLRHEKGKPHGGGESSLERRRFPERGGDSERPHLGSPTTITRCTFTRCSS